MSKPELLAPAGNLAVAMAAFEAGADAVYAGLEQFNARARNQNFSLRDFGRLIAYARKLGKRVYLTLNTLVNEAELAEMAQVLSALTLYTPDAVIVQDLGVVQMVRRFFPELTIHLSTQAGIHNSAGLELANELGVSRVILERQVTLDEMGALMAQAPLEVEVFVHGALCCSLSGDCLLSSWIGGNSGNRGECKQPCRKRFFSKTGNGFFFSTQDLYTLDLIPKLKAMGVASLKIEGRMKNPEYVRHCVEAYRMMIDCEHGEEQDVLTQAKGILSRASGRRWSHGFADEKSMRELIQPNSPGVSGTLLGNTVDSAVGGFAVRLKRRLHMGDRIQLHPNTGDEGFVMTVTEMAVDGKPVKSAAKGAVCVIGHHRPVAPSSVYKVGVSSAAERYPEHLPDFQPEVKLKVTADWGLLRIEPSVPGMDLAWEQEVNWEPAANAPLDGTRFARNFSAIGETPFTLGEVEFSATDEFFLPLSEMKVLRRDFWQWLHQHISVEMLADSTGGLMAFYEHCQQRFSGRKTVLDTLKNGRVQETYLLSNDADLPPKGHVICRSIFTYNKMTDEVVLPAFCSELRLDSLKRRIERAYNDGIRRFRVTSLYGLALVRELADIQVNVSFPLPVCNSMAVELLEEWGVSRAQLWVELEQRDKRAILERTNLPLEVWRFGRIPLLETRAKVSVNGDLRDAHQGRYRVEEDRAAGIWRLYPAEVLKEQKITGTYDFYDYTSAHPGNRQNRPFNVEGVQDEEQ